MYLSKLVNIKGLMYL